MLSKPIKQKFDPFADDTITVCGDCGKVLTDKNGVNLHSGFFEQGVRCAECYAAYFKKTKKTLIGLLDELGMPVATDG